MKNKLQLHLTLFTILQKSQANSYLRAFALPVPSDWNFSLLGICRDHFFTFSQQLKCHFFKTITNPLPTSTFVLLTLLNFPSQYLYHSIQLLLLPKYIMYLFSMLIVIFPPIKIENNNFVSLFHHCNPSVQKSI